MKKNVRKIIMLFLIVLIGTSNLVYGKHVTGLNETLDVPRANFSNTHETSDERRRESCRISS